MSRRSSSNFSSSSFSRSRSLPGRYRKVAPNSHVDESLFGYPDQKDSSTQVKTQQDRGEMIQIITRDLIRNLRIPSRDPSGGSITLSRAQFDKISSASKILTKEEKEAKRKAYQMKKEDELKAAEDRKKLMNKSRKENPVLTELELEAQEREERWVEQCNAVRMEQEEEIRQLNELIRGAQCQAIRDLQIQEKKMRQEEMIQEERCLDLKMEEVRRIAAEARRQMEEERKQQRIEYKTYSQETGQQQINEQIEQHRLERKMQDEMKAQEGLEFREKIKQMAMEDLKALEKKREEQQLLQEEIMRINAKSMHAKEQKKEEEKMADLRDREYIQKKMEREAEYEEEQRQIKKAKDLEIAELWAQQKSAKDTKAEQDELHARRVQESIERRWRKSEKEKATKKMQEEAMLREARLEQVRNKEQCLSNEAGREIAEFQRVLKVQEQTIIRDKEQEERQEQKAYRNIQDIKNQVQERAQQNVAKRKELIMEADRQREEARQKQLRIDQLKEKKLKELMATGLADKYCKEVIRKTQPVSLL